jgi:hypothetical protein
MTAFLIWLLRLFGLNNWAAALEAKDQYEKQAAVEKETKIAQEVEHEKEELAETPDDQLDDLLDELRDDAVDRRGSDPDSGSG